jgi:DNA-binding CsgD family transcriptional regulator
LVSAGPRFGVSSPPLYGRDRERAALDAYLDRVRGGRSAVLLLRGEAGIGKTALLDYLVESGSGLTLIRSTGVESAMELPFTGLHDVCSPILDGLGSLPEPQQHALSVALGRATGESPDKFLVALGALGLLAAASERAPILCVIEDAHWLDQASAQVLGFVGRRLLAEPVGLVFAARPTTTSPDHLMGLPELRIEGLDQASARALLKAVSGTPVDEAVRARIIEETQGNPLALLELGAQMMTAGFAPGFEPITGANLSRRIEEEYLSRVSAFPQDAQQLLLLAAADPVGETALILRAATTLNLGADAADAAIDAGLLSIGTSVRFRHPLLRSAIYRNASIERRRAAHQALAAGTDSDVDADRRAWHQAYAAHGPDEQVADELIRSADRAGRRGGVAAAAAFWERAVDLTPDPGDRSARALVAAHAKFTAGDFEGCRRLLAEAEARPLAELQQAEVECLRGQIAFGMRRGADAPPVLLQAATRLEPLDIELARQTYLQALFATEFAGRLLDPEVRLDIGRAAQALPLDPTPTTTQLLVHGLATRIVDGYTAAAPTLKDAVRQFRNDPLGPGWESMAACTLAMDLCDDDAWYATVSSQVDLARKSGMLSWLPFFFDFLSEFYVHAGEFAQAQALLAELDRIDPTITVSSSPHVALLLAAWHGDVAEAGKLTEAILNTDAHGAVLTFTEYAKAVLLNGRAEHGAAADAAQSAAADDLFVVSTWALYELAEAAARSDQPDRAHVATARLSEIAAASGSDFACGMAVRSRALVAEGDTADEHHREAIERFSRTRMMAHLGRARLSYGEWLRRNDRQVDARSQLKLAYEALSAMGANAFAERARRELQATGEKVRRRTEPAANPLTPQEEQIAQLARTRLTNPEIGAQLFLSARTVEWHLRKIFTKLGITSRRELDAALARRDKSLSASV